MTADTADTADTAGLAPSPFFSGAMLTTRDGIVGAWNPPRGHPGVLEPDHPDPLSRWEPWVRRNVIGFEILSSLRFSSAGGKEDAAGTLSVRGGNIIQVFRPTPDEILECQLSHVFGYAELRRDRASEIHAQLSEFVSFFDSTCDLNLENRRFTLELLTALRAILVPTQMRVKHALALPRPVDFSPQIMPMIQTPGHSSFPAGHAVEAFAFAMVLAELTAEREKQLYPSVDPSYRPLRDQLMRVAARISVNRVVAGVHFPVDIAAGLVLGTLLGRYFVALATGNATSLPSWTFDARNYGKDDFRWRDMLAVIDSGGKDSLSPELGGDAFLGSYGQFDPDRLPYKSPSDSPLGWLWSRAAQEWWKVE